MKKKAVIKGEVLEMPGEAPPVVAGDMVVPPAMNEAMEKAMEEELTDKQKAHMEEVKQVDAALAQLQKLLAIGKTAAFVARLIADEQIQVFNAYKRRTHKRRLNEKESFTCFSLGAANFVTKLQGNAKADR